MNKRFRMSPGAPSLVLIVVVLSMSIMGMLMFIRTQNDRRLSDRSMLVAWTDTALTEKAEEAFADLDQRIAACKKDAQNDEDYLQAVEQALPENMEMDGRQIFWQEEENGRALYAAVVLCPLEDDLRIIWHTRTLKTEVENIWNEF